MSAINKQDVLRTVLTIWLIAATGYIVYDQYVGYKVRGIQQAFQDGYVKSVDDLIQKTKNSKCQPFEVKMNDESITLIDFSCTQSENNQQGTAPQK